MDIKAFRGLSGTYNVRANERDRGPPCNIECLVQFLDNTQHKFVLDRRSKGQALLDQVFAHLNLIETDFFGLKYTPKESQSLQINNDISRTVATSKSKAKLVTTSSPKAHSLTSQNRSPSSNASLSSIACSSATEHVPADPKQQANGDIPKVDSPSLSHSPTKTNSISTDNNCKTTTTTTTNTTYSSTNINTNCSASNQTEFNANSKTVNGDSSVKSVSNNNIISCTKTPGHSNAKDDNSITKTSDTPSSLEERWLDPTKSIRKQYKSNPPFKFYFRVKFYVSDPCKLADDATRNHLYLQLRQDILNDRLTLPTGLAILLASYILQSEFGDYKRELLEDDYASKIKLLPNQSEDIKKKIIEVHKQHEFLSSADAEFQFLLSAKQLDCYGVEFCDAIDSSGDNVRIGVSSNGIVIFKDNEKMNQFSWAKITKIMFKKKIFSIQLRREEEQTCETFLEYNLLMNQACKSFWEECVAQHSFFRLHQPKSPPKKFFSFLNFGSKFQYNGKTEYQTMEENKKRAFSHFSRSPSKRYARITIPIGRPSCGEFNNHDRAGNKDKKSADGRSTNADSTNLQIDSSIAATTSGANSDSSSTTSSSPPSTLAESICLIKSGLESKKLIDKFDKLSRKKEDEPLLESKLIENLDKNRYQDILPYDSTRVPLMDSMTGDYINASFVNMTVPSGSVNKYIATQGPLSSTCEDFWQMVWEQNCSLIIMVTPLVEAGRVKCHKYWPDEKEEVRYGQLMIHTLSEKSKTATINRTIQLVDVKSGEKRTTMQIQYKAWPDHEVPKDCGDFLKLVNYVRKHRTNKPDEPIVVHCSAGIGRTGVLILMETAICIMESGEPINPIKILEDMRKQRAMLIQTSSQFEFVASAICKVYDQKLFKKNRKSRKK